MNGTEGDQGEWEARPIIEEGDSGFLTDSDFRAIEKYLFTSPGESSKDRFDKNSLGGAMYDMRLGEEVFLSMEKSPRILTDGEPHLTIKPGEFALLTTYESLNIPIDLIGFISIRFSVANQGLINISGFHVDPGYRGKLIFSVQNGGPKPVSLRYREPVFMLVLATLTKKTYKFKGEGIQRIERKHIQGVVGPPISLRSLGEKVQRLETQMKVLLSILAAVVASVLVFLLTVGMRT